MVLGTLPSVSGTAEDQFKDELKYYVSHYESKKLITICFNTTASNIWVLCGINIRIQIKGT